MLIPKDGSVIQSLKTHVILSLFIIVGSVAALWTATAKIDEWSVLSPVLLSLAGALLSLSLFTILDTFVLRKSIAEDMTRLSQLSVEARRAGFQNLKYEHEQDWSAVLKGVRRLRGVVRSPHQFETVLYPNLLQAATQRSVKAEIILQALDDEVNLEMIMELTARWGQQARPDSQLQVSQARVDLGAAWLEADTRIFLQLSAPGTPGSPPFPLILELDVARDEARQWERHFEDAWQTAVKHAVPIDSAGVQ